MDLATGQERAAQKMLAATRQRCAGAVPGDTHRDLLVSSTLSALRFRYALLPVWICAYRYRERVYQFMVSGQTGEVVGRAPWSALKIALLLALGLALGALLYYLHVRTPG